MAKSRPLASCVTPTAAIQKLSAKQSTDVSAWQHVAVCPSFGPELWLAGAKLKPFS